MKPTRPPAIAALVLILLGAASAGADDAFDLALSAAQHLYTVGQYQQFGALGEIRVDPVRVVGEMTFQNDEKYEVAEADFWLGFNATLDQGGAEIDLDRFSLRAGRFRHGDFVDSPYSLFVSSRPLSALLVDLSLETDRLFYTTRWLDLNRDSQLGYPDRGANIRTYGLRFDALRVGFHDALVYAGRRFDFEYLVSPVPGFFLQYVKVSSGAPWSETGNDNSLLGFFADYDANPIYGYGQILIDDINFNALVYPDRPQNPSKIAWSLGGRYDLAFGTLGFHHAGATKYTFQSFGGGEPGASTDERYGYTYYPGVEYTVDGTARAIAPEENYIGYLHGENNLAFMTDFTTTIEPVDLLASLELTVSGAKSPGNPWHEFNAWPEGGQGTKFLDGDRLESRVTLRGRATMPIGSWSVHADLSVGYVANELELTSVPAELSGGDPDNSTRYFIPGATSGAFASLEIGGSCRLPVVEEVDATSRR